jgi:hypothetical protein
VLCRPACSRRFHPRPGRQGRGVHRRQRCLLGQEPLRPEVVESGQHARRVCLYYVYVRKRVTCFILFAGEVPLVGLCLQRRLQDG